MSISKNSIISLASEIIETHDNHTSYCDYNDRQTKEWKDEYNEDMVLTIRNWLFNNRRKILKLLDDGKANKN